MEGFRRLLTKKRHAATVYEDYKPKMLNSFKTLRKLTIKEIPSMSKGVTYSVTPNVQSNYISRMKKLKNNIDLSAANFMKSEAYKEYCYPRTSTLVVRSISNARRGSSKVANLRKICGSRNISIIDLSTLLNRTCNAFERHSPAKEMLIPLNKPKLQYKNILFNTRFNLKNKVTIKKLSEIPLIAKHKELFRSTKPAKDKGELKVVNGTSMLIHRATVKFNNNAHSVKETKKMDAEMKWIFRVSVKLKKQRCSLLRNTRICLSIN
eukprot:TRINITY_DN2521_c0_g1_i2.p1 TRINITY_DN2521_c0_g1~~TRINITY_DN2521_c0_g1_i2.p1  ORF type:complete len:265 (-),score=47.34 TRINITY_DN2521_c0_g1_i2:148-942(-)